MASNKLAFMVRSFSTSNIRTALVKPPIQIFGIDGRYAHALYSAASKQKSLEAVEKDLIKLQTTLKSDIKLYEFILNPTIKRSLKSNGLKEVSTKMSLNAQTSNLLQVLAENGRLKKLDAIINSFKIIMASHRGEVHCEVTTAKQLESSQKQKLESVLKKFIKSNELVLLTTKVDPTILGGMIVSIGDRYADMSVANKIKKYTTIISQAV